MDKYLHPKDPDINTKFISHVADPSKEKKITIPKNRVSSKKMSSLTIVEHIKDYKKYLKEAPAQRASSSLNALMLVPFVTQASSAYNKGFIIILGRCA